MGASLYLSLYKRYLAKQLANKSYVPVKPGIILDVRPIPRADSGGFFDFVTSVIHIDNLLCDFDLRNKQPHVRVRLHKGLCPFYDAQHTEMRAAITAVRLVSTDHCLRKCLGMRFALVFHRNGDTLLDIAVVLINEVALCGGSID